MNKNESLWANLPELSFDKFTVQKNKHEFCAPAPVLLSDQLRTERSDARTLIPKYSTDKPHSCGQSRKLGQF